MFVTIDGSVHVADPNDRRALSLLKHTETNCLQKRYVVLVMATGGLFLAPGILTFTLTAVFYRQWQPKVAGVVVFLLCLAGALFLGKAALTISRDRQARRFKKQVKLKRILQLPKTPSGIFVKLLTRADSIRFLTHYHPTPFDLADLKSIIEDYEKGLASKRHRRRTHKPLLTGVVKRITQARKAAEEASAAQSGAMQDLPRPSGD